MHHDQIDREIRDVLTEDANRLRPDAKASRERMLGGDASPRVDRRRLVLGLGVAAAVAAVALLVARPSVREAITPAQGGGCAVGAEIHSEACRNDPDVDFQRMAEAGRQDAEMYVIARGTTDDETPFAFAAYEHEVSSVIRYAPVPPGEMPPPLRERSISVIRNDGWTREFPYARPVSYAVVWDEFSRSPDTFSTDAVLGVVHPEAAKVGVRVGDASWSMVDTVRVGDIEAVFFVVPMEVPIEPATILVKAYDADGKEVPPGPPPDGTPPTPPTPPPRQPEGLQLEPQDEDSRLQDPGSR